MKTFWLSGICLILTSIESDLTVLKIAERNGKGAGTLAPRTIENLGAMIATIVGDLGKMGGFLDTVLLGHRLIPRLTANSVADWSVSRMIEALMNFQHQLSVDMGKHRWARIDGKYEIYLINPQPWGDAVYDIFEASRQDIVDAGLAMGAELHTAAVFHLMRVAEYGLRRLAAKLKVTLSDKGKRMPVDYATWGKVIDGCKSRIATGRTMVSGPKKQLELERYARAADHCDYFKDMWRNDISHAHRTYNQQEAEGVMLRVREFMQFLATI
jgi:hypothetical protein